MSKGNVIALAGRDEGQDPLTDMLRVGAQQLTQQPTASLPQTRNWHGSLG